MSKKDSAAVALKALQAAVEKAADALARDGLYIENVSIHSKARQNAYEHMTLPQPRRMYDREVIVHLTNRLPDYASSF